MSKRKGLSLEEKRGKVLEVFTESADVFVLKVRQLLQHAHILGLKWTALASLQPTAKMQPCQHCQTYLQDKHVPKSHQQLKACVAHAGC